MNEIEAHRHIDEFVDKVALLCQEYDISIESENGPFRLLTNDSRIRRSNIYIIDSDGITPY